MAAVGPSRENVCLINPRKQLIDGLHLLEGSQGGALTINLENDTVLVNNKYGPNCQKNGAQGLLSIEEIRPKGGKDKSMEKAFACHTNKNKIRHEIIPLKDFSGERIRQKSNLSLLPQEEERTEEEIAGAEVGKELFTGKGRKKGKLGQVDMKKQEEQQKWAQFTFDMISEEDIRAIKNDLRNSNKLRLFENSSKCTEEEALRMWVFGKKLGLVGRDE